MTPAADTLHTGTLHADTIIAVSSASGHAPRMIVRLSGSRSWELLNSLGPSVEAGVHDARLHLDGLAIPARCLAFRGPTSATGEDVVELHLPGNPHLARRVLAACLKGGARLAEPGEFTARAFFHGKLSLDAAEGVGVAVGASNAAELSAARQLMAGALADRLRPSMDLLLETLALVEVGIDFSDEDVTFLDEADLRRRWEQVVEDLRRLLADAPRLERLSHTPTIVLAGPPNAGKSTLLNALAGIHRAVISPMAGTTRDVLTVRVALESGDVELCDVAGLDDRRGVIEDQMRAHAEAAVRTADVLVEVSDHPEGRRGLLPREPDLRVVTKHDLHGVGVSAQTGHGLAELRDELDRLAFGTERATLALNIRHRSEVESAVAALESADLRTPELLAADLRRALDHLGAVLGKVTPDDVLGQIFGRFCIGK